MRCLSGILVFLPQMGHNCVVGSHLESVNAVADLLFVDIQLWFPPVDMVNVDVRENVPIGLFCWTVGWREVF